MNEFGNGRTKAAEKWDVWGRANEGSGEVDSVGLGASEGSDNEHGRAQEQPSGGETRAVLVPQLLPAGRSPTTSDRE
jgi:hypothetical protein